MTITIIIENNIIEIGWTRTRINVSTSFVHDHVNVKNVTIKDNVEVILIFAIGSTISMRNSTFAAYGMYTE